MSLLSGKKQRKPARLIIFTRYPEPGKAKTRLIPVLGPRGAADLQRQMAERTLLAAREVQVTNPYNVEVRFDGGDQDLFRRWLGPDLVYSPQGPGNLGERMARALREALRGGARRVILIGTDIPDLSGKLIGRGFDALEDNDLVLGPTRDGGYYLIGIHKFFPRLFEGISWGTEEVLNQTLRIAADRRLTVCLLDRLADVDRPEDLPIWEKNKPGK